MPTSLLTIGLMPLCLSGAAFGAELGYRVLLERSVETEFRPAAERLAKEHDVPIELFDPSDLRTLRDQLRADPAREAATHVAFVVAPQTLDVQFAQDLLIALTEVDEDPFVDVTYAFITGRSGTAALRFVEQGIAGRARPLTGNAGMFGSWEGAALPTQQPLSALKAFGFEGTQRYVKVTDPAEARAREAREALASFAACDLTLLFSHGHPDRMEFCFSGRDLREWKASLPPSVVINCACWNGATGRWWEEGPNGPIQQASVSPDDSVALAMLDTGCAAYIAGLDPWHGPLAMRYAFQLLDDGCTLGEAAKETFDRLTLEFAPARIRLDPVAQRGPRREGTDNRRRNSAAIVVFGDPSWAPFAARPTRLISAKRNDAPAGQRIEFTVKPLVEGSPGADFMLPQGRIMDYHSVRTENWMKEAKLEFVRTVDWPERLPAAPVVRVVEATVRGQALPCGEVQALIELTPKGRRLHVRVPINVPAMGSMWPMGIATGGATIVLSAEAPSVEAPR
ncbi:MAG: hypothetical protein JNL80_11710 [Phycisphaerae bacterium]|jgi:hypothetical protein|nr:hypothetical protein [Phycisphaerae bacterium]